MVDDGDALARRLHLRIRLALGIHREDEAELARACKRASLRPPRPSKDVFINYISPVHYNAIAALQEVGRQRA